MNIYFYGLEQEDRAYICDILEKKFAVGQSSAHQLSHSVVKINHIFDDGQTPLEQILKNNKNIDLLFTENSKNLFNAANFLENLPEDYFIGLSKSLSSQYFNTSVQSADKKYAVPILLETYSLMIDKDIEKKINLPPPLSISELEKIIDESKDYARFPFVFAGAANKNLFFLLSYLLAADSDTNNPLLFAPVESSDELNENYCSRLVHVVDIISQWQRKGWLKSSCMNLTVNDLKVIMEFKNAAVVFAGLKDIGKIPESIISRYSQYNIPLPDEPASKYLPANMIVIAKPHKRSMIAEREIILNEIIEYCLSKEGQTVLAKYTGLAPVNNSVESSLMQIQSKSVSDTAFALVPSIENIFCSDKEGCKKLSEKIRTSLYQEDAGY